MAPEVVNRTRSSNRVQAQPARSGNAGVSFPGKPGKPKKQAALIYGGWFRVLFGGSNRVQAQPAGSNRLSALPT